MRDSPASASSMHAIAASLGQTRYVSMRAAYVMCTDVSPSSACNAARICLRIRVNSACDTHAAAMADWSDTSPVFSLHGESTEKTPIQHTENAYCSEARYAHTAGIAMEFLTANPEPGRVFALARQKIAWAFSYVSEFEHNLRNWSRCRPAMGRGRKATRDTNACQIQYRNHVM